MKIHPPRDCRSAASDTELQDLTGIWKGLLRKGLIAGDLTDHPDAPFLTWLRWTRLSAVWWLAPAPHATAVNRVYQRLHPVVWEQTSVPAAVAHDPQAWTAWLTGTD